MGEKKWESRQEAREVSEEEEPGVGWRRCTITLGFYCPLKGKLSCKKKVSLYFGNFNKQIVKDHVQVQNILSNLILLFRKVGWLWWVGDFLFR